MPWARRVRRNGHRERAAQRELDRLRPSPRDHRQRIAPDGNECWLSLRRVEHLRRSIRCIAIVVIAAAWCLAGCSDTAPETAPASTVAPTPPTTAITCPDPSRIDQTSFVAINDPRSTASTLRNQVIGAAAKLWGFDGCPARLGFAFNSNFADCFVLEAFVEVCPTEGKRPSASRTGRPDTADFDSIVYLMSVAVTNNSRDATLIRDTSWWGTSEGNACARTPVAGIGVWRGSRVDSTLDGVSFIVCS